MNACFPSVPNPANPLDGSREILSSPVELYYWQLVSAGGVSRYQYEAVGDVIFQSFYGRIPKEILKQTKKIFVHDIRRPPGQPLVQILVPDDAEPDLLVGRHCTLDGKTDENGNPRVTTAIYTYGWKSDNDCHYVHIYPSDPPAVMESKKRIASVSNVPFLSQQK